MPTIGPFIDAESVQVKNPSRSGHPAKITPAEVVGEILKEE